MIRPRRHVAAGHVDGHGECDVVAELEEQAGAADYGLAATHVSARTGSRGIASETAERTCAEFIERIEIIQIAVLIAVHDGNASSAGGRDRAAECRLELHGICIGIRIELAERNVGVTTAFLETRLTTDVLNGATCRVAAEQCALWSLENLNPLNIEKGKCLRLRNRDITLVEVDCSRGLDDVIEIVLRDTSNRKLRILASQVAADVHAWRISRDIEAVFDAQRFHLVACKRRNRNTNVLNVLFALLRGDHDLLQNTLRDCRLRNGEYQYTGHAIREIPVLDVHVFPPM